MEKSTSSSSGGPTSWFEITKTKILVLSSLLGIGTIFYFTKNYIEQGHFLPKSQWLGTKKSNTKQPKVIGGKRNVVIKEDINVKDSSKKVLLRQRSRLNSTSSSRRRDSVSSISKGKIIRKDYSFAEENIDINLNHAINDLKDSVSGVEEILGITTKGSGNENNHVIEGEIEKLRKLLDFAQDVQQATHKTSDYVLNHQHFVQDVISDTNIEPPCYEGLIEELFEIDDDYDSADDSFISATESIDLDILEDDDASDVISFSMKLKELIKKHSKDDFYMHGIEYLTNYGVPVRSLRTELMGCDNDVDFSVKVYCLRRAFSDIMKNSEHKKWFVESGKEMLVTLLKESNYDHVHFSLEFDKMVNYCSNHENWSDIDIELSGRGVCHLNFYDIILDFMIMDSFQDLENPPYTVTAALQNRWLSLRIKETTLSTAIWTVIKTKKRRLENQDGFFANFYDISVILTPVLAWGFLGPVKELNELCIKFKESAIGFMRDIFSTESANYKSVQTLAEDILIIAKKRKEEVLSFISR